MSTLKTALPLTGASSMRVRAGGQEESFDAPENAYECRGHIRYLRQGETVQAARLRGQQPVVVTIRNCAAAREITSRWRMRDLRRGIAFNVKGVPVESDDRDWLQVTAESGVAP